MTKSLLAGAVYFAVVFAIAFALGALRVMYVAPAVGPFWATLIELPIMLSVAWVACDVLMCRFAIRKLALALSMGVSALVLLFAAEAALAFLAFGQGLDEIAASYQTPHGLLGLAGQIAFGALPLLHYYLRKRCRD